MGVSSAKMKRYAPPTVRSCSERRKEAEDGEEQMDGYEHSQLHAIGQPGGREGPDPKVSAATASGRRG